MNQPDREHFERLLHAYELGLLSPAQEEECELLLLEYPELLAEVQQLETATHLMRNDPEIRERLADVIHSLPKQGIVAAGPPAGRPRWQRMWLAYAAAAVVILFLVLVDWQLEFSPSSEVIAADNRVAVICFRDPADLADTERWGEIATHLIITDLSESQYVQVVPEERIEDLLIQAGHDAGRPVNRDLALEIARESRARWLIMGEILLAKPNIAISSRLIDVQSGAVAASPDVYGRPDQNIFSVVDELSTQIRAGLSLPAIARREVDVAVADKTTHSPDAYRFYLAGRSQYYKFYYADAWENFQQAVKLDSTFAMVYYYLNQLDQPGALDKALRYVDRASQRDQVYIHAGKATSRGDYHRAIEELEQAIRRFPDYKEFYYNLGTYYRVVGQYEQSINYLKTALAMDPLYTSAYNGLAYAYFYAGQGDLALRTIDELVAIAPDEANSWDSKGEIYTMRGLDEQAIAAFETALTVKPDFFNSAFSLGLLHLRLGEYQKADSCFESQATNRNIFARFRMRTLLALTAQVRGEYQKALKLLAEGIKLDTQEAQATGFPERQQQLQYKQLSRARIFTELGDREMAIRENQKIFAGLEINVSNMHNQGFNLSVAQIFAVNGDSTTSLHFVERWRGEAHDQRQSDELILHITGALAFSAGNWESAVANLDSALALRFDVYSACLLAQAQLQLGEAGPALAWLKQTLDHRDNVSRTKYCFYQAKMYFLLGKTSQEAGDISQARMYFTRFLELREDADPGLPGVDEARAYLARMTPGQ